jgi:DNA-binding CsgD family transcriptional regulator
MPAARFARLGIRNDALKGRRLGADDCVIKPIDCDTLTAIIRARLARVARTAAWPEMKKLNDREAETLTWAARGKTSAEIALILGLSKRTVDFHIDNARGKLGVATRTQAAVKAATSGLIAP